MAETGKSTRLRRVAVPAIPITRKTSRGDDHRAIIVTGTTYSHSADEDPPGKRSRTNIRPIAAKVTATMNRLVYMLAPILADRLLPGSEGSRSVRCADY